MAESLQPGKTSAARFAEAVSRQPLPLTRTINTIEFRRHRRPRMRAMPPSPMVERAISQLARGNRKVGYRGVAKTTTGSITGPQRSTCAGPV